MNAILRIGEAANLIGVSTKTIRRWDKDGKISCFRTIGNHRRIRFIEIQRIISGKEIPEIEARAAVYARVSSHEQKHKGDLKRQIDSVLVFCVQNEYKSPVVFQNIGSGLNTKHKGFLKLF